MKNYKKAIENAKTFSMYDHGFMDGLNKALKIIEDNKFQNDVEPSDYDGIQWHNRALEKAAAEIKALKGEKE